MNVETKSIFVAIVGKPNVGKSTLLNRLVGEKVAIVTRKPQTTRSRVNGILTKGPIQYVFIDTPGIHKPKNKLGQRMTRTVKESMADGDAVVMLFDVSEPINESEMELVQSLKEGSIAVIGLINKIDKVSEKSEIENREKELSELGVFKKIIPISGVTGDGCDDLLVELENHAIVGPHYFTEDSYTDLPEKQLVAEIVREKLLINMHEEIPHGTAVEVERFHEREAQKIIDIDVVIYCERKSHKGMIIGKQGQMLKKIATEARLDSEEMLGSKVNLKCWVKVKDDWRDNEFLLNSLGFAK